jgi:hypothetical protein
MVLERELDDVTRAAEAFVRFAGAGDDRFGDFRMEFDEQRAGLMIS